MIKTKDQVWIELREAIETFEKMTSNSDTAMIQVTTQRLRVEMLLRELDTLSEKAA